MAKRPSYRSIRLRQRNIVEGMGTSDLRYSDAARRLGVTTAELKRFIEQKPKQLHANYNRSPSYKKLFEEGSRSKVREDFGLKRVRQYPYKERDIQLEAGLRKPSDKQIGRIIQQYYNENGHDRISWSIYSREHNYPNSIVALRTLYRNGKITRSQYASAINVWKATYGVTNEYAYRYESVLNDE